MATRKRTKSLNDIRNQLERITMSGLGNGAQASKRMQQAYNIARTYTNNIKKSRAYKRDTSTPKDFPETYRTTWSRQYENYNDKAKAASNG